MGEAKRRFQFRQQQSLELARQQLARHKRSLAAKRGAETRRLNEQRKLEAFHQSIGEQSLRPWL